MLHIKHLSHRYPGAATAALQGVSLHAERGQVLGLLGPNGAGKTTLISHLAGLLPLQEGQILIDGEPLASVRRSHPTRVAVAPQEYAFYAMLSVAENLACFAAAAGLKGAHQRQRINACIAFAQLEHFANTRAEQLSGGLKRRLNLAIALLPEPELLLFDEPAIRQLAQGGAAVIYTSHYMEEIEAIAQRVLIIDQGRVLREGPLDALLAEGAATLTLRAEGLTAQQLSRFGHVEATGDALCLHLTEGISPGTVLATLEFEGITLRHAQFGRYNLEQLFMSLTRRSLRDL
jgi:ABC-2 type transport system ATP-binding protein